MHTKVDKDTCIGCGACVAICPKVFEMGDDGKAYVIDQKGDNEDNINDAERICPVGAIHCDKNDKDNRGHDSS